MKKKSLQKGLGASARKASRSVSGLQSSAKKRKDLRPTPSRSTRRPSRAKLKPLDFCPCSPQDATDIMRQCSAMGLVEYPDYMDYGKMNVRGVWMNGGVWWCAHGSIGYSKNVLTKEEFMQRARNTPALGARRKPTKEAVPASRRTGAKRSPKGTGASRATPK